METKVGPGRGRGLTIREILSEGLEPLVDDVRTQDHATYWVQESPLEESAEEWESERHDVEEDCVRGKGGGMGGGEQRSIDGKEITGRDGQSANQASFNPLLDQVHGDAEEAMQKVCMLGNPCRPSSSVYSPSFSAS